MKVAVWVESLLGYGHVVRINTLLQMIGPCEALICSGSISHSSYLKSLLAEHKLLGLPALTINDTTKPYPKIATSGESFEAIISQRTQMLVQAILAHKPTHFIIEHFPFGRHGFASEILSVISVIRKSLPQCSIFCSVRDFAGAQPLEPIYQNTMSYYLSLFDNILVHGRKEIMDLSILYPQLNGVESRTIYTGYLYQDEPIKYNEMGSCFFDLGGGYNAIEVIGSAFYERLRTAYPKSFVIMKGIHSSETVNHAQSTGESLSDDFTGTTIINDHSKKSLKEAGISLIISRVGYNSACEILQNKIPAIIVPHGFSFEQQLRAAAIVQMERAVCIIDNDPLGEKDISEKLIEQAIDRAAHWDVEKYQWLFAEKTSLQEIFQAR